MIIRCLLSFVAVLFFVQYSCAQGVESQPAQQKTKQFITKYGPFKGARPSHPDFMLPSIDGDKMIRLSDYRGKKVLLLHFASW